MTISEHTKLMDAVLDGAAMPGEAQALEALLAGDPAARAEFEALRDVFEGLKGMPQAMPPEGLVSSVMARLPPPLAVKRPAGWGRVVQLFSRSSVIGASSTQALGAIPGKSATVHSISQQGPHFKGEKNMSETKSSFGKRKIWIGGGIAAAGLIVAVSTGILPPSGKDTSGTIVPAQRYMAPQNTAADVKTGNPGTQPAPMSTVGSETAASAQSGVQGGVQNGVQGGVQNGVQGGVQSGVQSALQSGVQSNVK
jgi:hypothetical protein